MSNNLKNLLVFVIGVLFPLTGIFLKKCFSVSKYFFWEYNCSESFLYIMNIVSLVALSYLIKQNWKSNRLILALLILLFLIFLLHFIILFGLSHITLF